ncbi:MAG: helix-turn-helix transcriptional regulator [Rickettsiales bacterium]|nr:helix-turn-helix transcriptional regulator [Rickettsiales bacterium]
MTKATKLDAEIGEKIRVNRVIKKRSQPWLGKNIGKSRQQLQNYEAGLHRVSASCLYTIASVLKVPVDKFFPEK